MGGKPIISQSLMVKELVAMILAGGQGTRLGKLTKEIAKPAVPFGGRYRIIDFTLSNCANSGIHNVGVVTQYEPLTLNEHVGNGASWGLDGLTSGVTILHPYASLDGEKWFNGTAHAIYQNISYIDSLEPEQVLILSGDHIYKMDYQMMLDFHLREKAELTVAVIEIPIEDCSRFGIMNTDEADRVIEFEEKPLQPKNNLASMGVYIFNWKLLRRVLNQSHSKDGMLSDFGKHVIPSYLNAGEKVVAYRFKGYWRDVGTIESLWQASMEFLDLTNKLNVRNKEWRIYSRPTVSAPHMLTASSKVSATMIADGCYVAGEVCHSILSNDVRVNEGGVIKDSVIMPGARIGRQAYVERSLIGEEAVIGDYAELIGGKEVLVVGSGEVIGVKKDED